MAKIYELDGKQYEFPDDTKDSEALAFLESVGGEAPDNRGYFGRVADTAKASFMQTTQGLAALASYGGADFADTIAEYERNMPKASAEMSKFERSDGFVASIKELFNDPETLPSLIISSATGSYPAIAGGAAGALAANPMTVAAGVGAGSLAVEAGTTFLDVFRESGVNLKDPEQVRTAFKNDELKSKAITKGLKRGIPVAALDALSAKFAGSLVKPALKRGTGIVGAGIAEMAVQSAAGGAGEALGSVAAGDKVSPSAVVAEMFAGIASDGAEIALGTVARRGDVSTEARNAEMPQTANAVDLAKRAMGADDVESGPITGVKEAFSANAETGGSGESDAIQPGSTSVQPTPEPPETIAEQIRLTADPKSTKAATLITPGEDVPEIPARLKTTVTKHGLVVYNPEQVSREDVLRSAEGEVFDGRILGMSSDGKNVSPSNVAVATSTGAAQNVVSELVPEGNQAAIDAAISAQQAAVPGGKTEVKPASQVLAQRQGGGSNEAQGKVQGKKEDVLGGPKIERPIEDRSRTDTSSGQFAYKYVVTGNDATEEWASSQVDRFGGDLAEAARQLRTATMTEAQRNHISAEIIDRASRRLGGNPSDLEAADILRSVGVRNMVAGTEQGQGLQSRIATNERIEPFAHMIAYLTGIQERAFKAVPKDVKSNLESMTEEARKAWNDATDEALQFVSEEDKDTFNRNGRSCE